MVDSLVPEYIIGGADLLCNDLQSDNIERVASIYSGEVWLEAVKCTQIGDQNGAFTNR